MTNAINSTDEAARTKSGNVKMPSYIQVSDWILTWAKKQTTEIIAKAFDVCGLVSENEFSVVRLHKPLRDCFAEEFSLVGWETEHAQLAINADVNNIVDDPGSIEIITESFSFFRSVFSQIECVEDIDYWLKETINRVKEFISADEMLSSLFQDDEIKQFDAGKPTGTGIEFCATANVLEINLNIVHVDKDAEIISEVKFNTENGTKDVKVMQFGDQFGVLEKSD